MPKSVQSYRGALQVVDDEFELVAERLIPRDDGVSFLLSGFDELGGFQAEGFARKIGDLYVAGGVPINYQHYKGDNRATISMTTVQRKNTACHVLGAWTQEGRTYSFGGVLKSYREKRPIGARRLASPPHLASAAEIESIKRKLHEEEREEGGHAKRERKLREYVERSSRKARKSRSKAARRDVLVKGKRLRGSAYSRRG